ncbi:hypothetical protein PSCLAVI8L_60023 [Pseudoclavibacter sp. 8L]|nr:hypothetical protein PSCLAVI8L_60023 [Pseudoclavibacter sp. 8L]
MGAGRAAPGPPAHPPLNFASTSRLKKGPPRVHDHLAVRNRTHRTRRERHVRGWRLHPLRRTRSGCARRGQPRAQGPLG